MTATATVSTGELFWVTMLKVVTVVLKEMAQKGSF
jgi:hypothetical protein